MSVPTGIEMITVNLYNHTVTDRWKYIATKAIPKELYVLEHFVFSDISDPNRCNQSRYKGYRNVIFGILLSRFPYICLEVLQPGDAYTYNIVELECINRAMDSRVI